MRPLVPETTPRELSDRLKCGHALVLLDVREPEELEICRLDAHHHIPLGDLPERFGELDPEKEIVVYCRSGNRSAYATEFLLEQGYMKAVNLSTGINGWATEVDSSVPVY